MIGMDNGESGAQSADCCMPGMRRGAASGDTGEHSAPYAVPLSRDGRLAQLTDQLAQIEAEQDALAHELTVLEAPMPQAVAEAEAVARAADEQIQERL